MRRTVVLMAGLAFGCGSNTPAPPTPTPTPTDPRCPGKAPSPTAICLQDCGPPVVRDGDPPPAFRWATAEDAANREKFGCPRCLDGTALIATPSGERSVATLVVGELVYTEDARGQRVAAPILQVRRVLVPPSHRVVVVTLEDGRRVRVSAEHPLATDGVVGNVVVGGQLDGSLVIDRQLAAPTEGATWDILPAGDTGHYWANGVRLGSTLRVHSAHPL